MKEKYESERYKDKDKENSKRSREYEDQNPSNVKNEELKNRYIEKISSEDYYRYNSEFRMWLYEKKKKTFSDLDKEDQRRYFDKFVKAWNSDKLKKKYYDGISSTQLQREENTGYKWKFASKLNQHELDTVKDSVDSATNKKYDTRKFEHTKEKTDIGTRYKDNDFYTKRAEEIADREDRIKESKDKRRRELSKKREYETVVLEELVPKETGREAMLEKKRAKAAYTKKEDSPDFQVSERDLYGGGDDFSSALAREKERTLRREEKRKLFMEEKAQALKSRMASYQAKEDATMEMLRKLANQNFPKKS